MRKTENSSLGKMRCICSPISRWWSTELVALGVHDWLIEVINMLVNFVTEFLFQKFVVYRGTIDTNELAKKEQA